ncbi:MAG: glycogen/starch/alpha-glucan phosphorylase, partial [Opitutales bacterium]
ATSYAVRDRILKAMMDTQARHYEADTRRAYYLSLEYLMGRLMVNNMISAGIYDETKSALESLGLDPAKIFDEEYDMGLGNGGLGRLAACFLDSLATLDLPAIGYGINYEFGIFKQEFENGRQMEHPDPWRQSGSPWELQRPEYSYSIPIYGHVEHRRDDKGDYVPMWVGTKEIIGLPSDVPIVGYGAGTVNFLRLWESRAGKDFDLTVFNQGGYAEAVREKAESETVSKVLYPNDKTETGKELRLIQQYFFVACSLKDIIRRFRALNNDWSKFPDKVTVQLNDTHPAIAIAEMMRILIDEEGFAWDNAWALVTKIFAYTNHTLLPEALEKWSIPLFERVLPRHLTIIYEINLRFLNDVVDKKWPDNGEMKQRLSIIEEGYPKMIRMAYLSVVGSHAVNGVAALHTKLLKQYLFNDFDNLWPEKIQNKTNGITPRRWLKACNLGLARLIDDSIGTDWPTDLDKLRGLEKFVDDKGFRDRYAEVKRQNKVEMANTIRELCGISVDPEAMFDVQIKRLHEYKRQHLNLLHILKLYRDLLHNPDLDIPPRVFIFGAKAAPGYDLAKEIIFAINKVGEKINHDSRINGKLKVAFLPNYRITLAEQIIPASDLSEQISTAGKEASGTGNMKLALNGALTIGTLDGANVEIKEQVGDENIFIFGLNVDEVQALRAQGYNPWDFYNRSEDLKAVLDWLTSDAFTPGMPGALEKVRQSVLDWGDPFLVCADFDAYCACQHEVGKVYQNRETWTTKTILNTARVGFFSSDRTIREYARDIWNLKPLPASENA